MSQGSPLLLLHPLGSDRSFWDDTVIALDGIDTVALDLPGHGTAAPLPEGSGISDFVEAVVGAIEVSGRERFHVAGMSLGGLVAQELAARHSDLVDRLVLIDTVATYPEPMRAMWRERADIARRNGLAELADPMEVMWFSERFRVDNEHIVKKSRELFLAMDPEGYARACCALESTDTTACVADIQAPTLLVCGSEDLPPFREAAIWLNEQITGSELTWLKGAKHAAVLEQSAGFAAALRTFLR